MSSDERTGLSGALSSFMVGAERYNFYSLEYLEKEGYGHVSRLPFSIKVLLEGALRQVDGRLITEEHVASLAGYDPASPARVEIPFQPSRVILQDFTGVPSVVDLAALRSAMARMGGDPELIQPAVPVDLVIDHSIQVDVFNSPQALDENTRIEFERNFERYAFLRWGQKAFKGFRVIPPATGIIHQVNLEYLARVVQTRQGQGGTLAFPDTLVGTDSHTPMINGLGVLGWGVGGIEAEAAMLGQPIYFLMPEVIGFKFVGRLREGVTATDLALTVTQILRARGVVGKFVEYHGPGLTSMTLEDRATIANMSPEYGATAGFFPVDAETLRYLRNTGRSEEQVALVEAYCKAQGLFRTDETPDPEYCETIELDLSTVEASLAGPKRPQDRLTLAEMKPKWREGLTKPYAERGFELSEEQLGATAEVRLPGRPPETIGHGAVVIASITSCTNTSNPGVMLGAGILARKAVQRGLRVKPYVKTSLGPGSRVVTEYLNKSGLTPYLEQLGFHTVGYGCLTCIGNSGPLPDPVREAIIEGSLIAASVLSGNRNFEGRINPYTKANYLASPPLVVAYALAGTVDIDLTREPLGVDSDGKPVYLADIWPTTEEILEHLERAADRETFLRIYSNVESANPMWNEIPAAEGAVYEWDPKSTYIQEPPFFLEMAAEPAPIQPIHGARVLVEVGDSVTTDHISPAGAIAEDSPAGQYLISLGVVAKDFNSYGSRRGNDRVMTRGTFANVRLKNQLAPGTEGGWTTHWPSGEVTTIFEASQRYSKEGTPLLVVAGKDYGMGSSRDWAAKGTLLLGIKAVIAESFERIHRSNLVGMGVLPLQFKPGETAASLGITGRETFTIDLSDELEPGQELTVTMTDGDGRSRTFQVLCRLDTHIELEYYRNGGILHTVLRKLLQRSKSSETS
jgi:aconitate hydratase